MARPRNAIDRRALITGRILGPDQVVAPPGGEIASILVQARPESSCRVSKPPSSLWPAARFYGRDPRGKLVVVVDRRTGRRRMIGSTLNVIALLPDVYSPRRLCFTPSMPPNCMSSRELLMTAPKARPSPGPQAGGGRHGGASPAAWRQPAMAANLFTERARSESELKWDKAPCRFCGTGCSVMVATKENRVVATHGDIKSEVNRGLNCVKGYFLSKIMYGQDRLTRNRCCARPAGKYDKNGEFTPVSWDEAFDVMAEKFKAALKKRGPSGVGMFGSGQWTIWEGYAAAQADEGRLSLQQPRSQCAALHGLGGSRLHAHLRHRRADGLL